MTNTIISIDLLVNHLDDPDWAVVDCRYDLNQSAWGQESYLESHIPGAVYADLESDLSMPASAAGGRHPLPSTEQLTATFSKLGIDRSVLVVAYDSRGGGFAARLWWCLRYLGHDHVAVLDGGYPAWLEHDLPIRDGEESRPPRIFQASPRPEMRIDAAEVKLFLEHPEGLIIDSRAPERYSGEEEPLDPVAGHIPGAVNRFWEHNLDPTGMLLPPDTLHACFMQLFGERNSDPLIVYCGSGVTACHNILAMEVAGIKGARLYAGSWSQWCTDSDNPTVSDFKEG